MKNFSGSAVPRQQVFVFADGTYVVQWDDHRVQELLSGIYREYEVRRDFGHMITDYELKQLKAAGRVEHYNSKYVWLFPLPEVGRYGTRKTMDRGNRLRAYYLTTSLPSERMVDVKEALTQDNFDKTYQVGSRSGYVVVLDKSGMPFRSLEDVENVREKLQKYKLGRLTGLGIGFLEVDIKEVQKPRVPTRATLEFEQLSLDDIISSQEDTAVTAGRDVILAISIEEEREAFLSLFHEMQLDIKIANNGEAAIQAVEDHKPDLLVMDMQLTDMHVWQFMNKLKEITTLEDLPIMIVADESNMSALKIVQAYYLSRPVSIARTRHLVWKILRDKK